MNQASPTPVSVRINNSYQNSRNAAKAISAIHHTVSPNTIILNGCKYQDKCAATGLAIINPNIKIDPRIPISVSLRPMEPSFSRCITALNTPLSANINTAILRNIATMTFGENLQQCSIFIFKYYSKIPIKCLRDVKFMTSLDAYMDN